MNRTMKQRVGVVIGIGPGIGLSVARRFAAEGYSLGLISRRGNKLSELADALALDGFKAHPVIADAAKPVQLQAAIREVERALGPIEVLIYNAYMSKPGAPSELGHEDLEATLQVNLFGALQAAQAVIPSMRRLGRGSLLFTGGGLALRPSAELAALSVGKAALRALVGSLAQELAPDGIHVATVTVRGQVKAGTALDPDLIAEKFWELHNQERSQWLTEVVYKGE